MVSPLYSHSRPGAHRQRSGSHYAKNTPNKSIQGNMGDISCPRIQSSSWLNPSMLDHTTHTHTSTSICTYSSHDHKYTLRTVENNGLDTPTWRQFDYRTHCLISPASVWWGFYRKLLGNPKTPSVWLRWSIGWMIYMIDDLYDEHHALMHLPIVIATNALKTFRKCMDIIVLSHFHRVLSKLPATHSQNDQQL